MTQPQSETLKQLIAQGWEILGPIRHLVFGGDVLVQDQGGKLYRVTPDGQTVPYS